jgi:hypothetical protein
MGGASPLLVFHTAKHSNGSLSRSHSTVSIMDGWMHGWVRRCMATLAAGLLPVCRALCPAASVLQPALPRHLSQCIAAGVCLGALPIMT